MVGLAGLGHQRASSSRSLGALRLMRSSMSVPCSMDSSSWNDRKGANLRLEVALHGAMNESARAFERRECVLLLLLVA